MAKTNDRDRYQYGICTNRDKDGGGKPCPKCESREVQQARNSQDLVCDECKEPLRRVAPPKKGIDPKIIIAIAVSVVIVAGIIWGVSSFFKGGKGEISGDDLIGAVETPSATDEDDDEGSSKPGDEVETDKSQTQPVVIQSIALSSENIEGAVGDKDVQLDVVIAPGEAEKELGWKSSNPDIASVDSDGKITFKKVGEATISVMDFKSEKEAKCLVKVKKKGSGPNGGETVPHTESGKLQLGYATYEGQVKNRKANGTGTLTFTSSHRLSANDDQNRTAEAGDYFVGQFTDNEPYNGKWYGKDGSPKGSLITKKLGVSGK